MRNTSASVNCPLYLILLLFLLGIPHNPFAQSPYLQQITNRDGLPSMTVYDIMQGSDGYLWLGTEAGICRFDGQHFETFQVPTARGTSFSGLQKDSQGNIYFLTFGGQLFYIDRALQVHEVVLPKEAQVFGFQDFLIDTHNNIWISTETGKVFLRKSKKVFWQNLSHLFEEQTIFMTFYLDNDGNSWIKGDNYVYQVNAQLEVAKKIRLPQNVKRIVVMQGQLMAYETNKKKIWQYDFHLQQWQTILPDLEKHMTSQRLQVKPLGNQELWIHTNQEVAAYSWQQQQLIGVFLKNRHVSGVIQDWEGNYWFTTIGHGLFLMPNQEIVHFNSRNSNLHSEQVNCLAEDHLGNVLIGTNGNQIFYYDTDTHQLTAQYQMKTDDVECLLFDSTSHTLYAENDDLFFYDVASKQNLGQVLAGSTPKDLAIYQNKYLVIAAGHSARLLPLPRNYQKYPLPPAYFKNYPASANKQEGIRLRFKRSRTVCVEASQKRFWVGYADGLYYYENGQPQELESLDHQKIIAIDTYCDQEGIVWVGTAQQGIFAIKDAKIILHLDKSKGLISNNCRVVKQGDELFIGTDQGLQVYHLKTRQSRIFNQQDGLPLNEIKDLIVQKDKIYLATAAGFSVLNRHFDTRNTHPPLIHIKSVWLRETPQKLQSKYRLAYDQNNLSIGFTGIALRSRGKFYYKYRMQGLDKAWTISKSRNDVVRYSSLPSGTYQFQVKAINEDGIESKEAATIHLVIGYPIWEKWWFITLVILLGLVLVSTIFFYRIRAIRRKNQLEQALGTATHESLKLQMNPHFIFNAMTAIQRYMLKNNVQQTSNYLARFARLMRGVLENARSEYISLTQEIEMLENYLMLQNLQYQGQFNYQINIDPALDPEEFAIPPMFAQPFIENAIEHGITHMKNAGEIVIHFALYQETIKLEIQDNGVGLQRTQDIQKNKKHQSLATQITRERIRLYQKSLKQNINFEVNSSEKGTQVLFYLPYKII